MACPLWVKSRHVPRTSTCPLYPPNSDIDCVLRHVCFGPKADIPFGMLFTVRSKNSPDRFSVGRKTRYRIAGRKNSPRPVALRPSRCGSREPAPQARVGLGGPQIDDELKSRGLFD